jgi:hypothetical protein
MLMQGVSKLDTRQSAAARSIFLMFSILRMNTAFCGTRYPEAG